MTVNVRGKQHLNKGSKPFAYSIIMDSPQVKNGGVLVNDMNSDGLAISIFACACKFPLIPSVHLLIHLRPKRFRIFHVFV